MLRVKINIYEIHSNKHYSCIGYTNSYTASKFVYQPGIVFTSMANADDVLSGDSYFMAELKSIKRIVEIPDNQKIYCFIDEILKVPNTNWNELPLQNQYYHFT